MDTVRAGDSILHDNRDNDTTDVHGTNCLSRPEDQLCREDRHLTLTATEAPNHHTGAFGSPPTWQGQLETEDKHR